MKQEIQEGCVAWSPNDKLEDLITLSNASVFIKKPRNFEWMPQDDITTHELALCVPILVNRNFDYGMLVDKLPENAKRHFKEQ